MFIRSMNYLTINNENVHLKQYVHFYYKIFLKYESPYNLNLEFPCDLFLTKNVVCECSMWN